MKKDPAIPEGFRRVERPTRIPFNELVGPFHERRQGETVSLGLRIEERHLNSRGFCHGGLLATLADLALGYATLAHARGPTNFVTVHLSIDYVDAAREGDWVESQVDIQRIAATLAFANCYLLCAERRIVHASAIFALPGKK